LSSDKLLNLLGLAKKAGVIIIGTDGLIKNFSKVKLIFLAFDASVATKDKIIKKAFFYHVPIIDKYHSETISQAIGKSKIKLVSITDQGFSKKMLELVFQEKEVITYEG